MQACPLKRCIKDEAYAIVKNNKAYRITFSRSLAEHIVSKLGDGY